MVKRVVEEWLEVVKMDCCNKEHKEKMSKKNNEKVMSQNTKNILLWGFIAILAIIVLYVLFFSGGSVNESTISAGRTASQTASSYSGMVGGC